jgi:hypothetical protein
MDDLVNARASHHERIRLKVRPNAFLYALEASRIHLLIMLAMVALPIPIHMERGFSLAFLAPLMLILFGLFGAFLFVILMIAARCMMFIITDNRAIVCMSVMGRITDRMSVPIESIESIEVSSYNARYGSVYLKRYGASPHRVSPSDSPDYSRGASSRGRMGRPRGLAIPILRSGWASIWFSTPSPKFGFYGFEHFEAFAALIAELRAAA